MGYYVRGLSRKKSLPNWKVQFVSYKDSDFRSSKALKQKREWDVSTHRWQVLGFHRFMTVSEARARAKQLNAQSYLRRQEERLRKIDLAKWEARKRYDAFLPAEFVAEFETRFIRKRDSQTEQGLRSTTRAFVTWNATQRMIVALAVEPSEWFYFTNQVYDYFVEQKMSLKYLSSVIKMANLWGFYFSRKLARPFLPIPLPQVYERQRLIDANYEKKGVARASKPISPIDLQGRKGKIPLRHFNWLFLSVWFATHGGGLTP